MTVDLAFQQRQRRPVGDPSLPVVQRWCVAQPQNAIVNDHPAQVDRRGVERHERIFCSESGVDELANKRLLYLKYPTRCVPGVGSGADQQQIGQDRVVAVHLTRIVILVIEDLLPGQVVGQ